MQEQRNTYRIAVFGVAGIAVPAALAFIASGPVPSAADDGDPPPPIQLDELGARARFTDDLNVQFRIKLDGRRTEVLNLRDPSRIVTGAITVQPDAQFPWHSHAGPVLVAVAEGELTYVNADDCVERVYPAGTAFVDPGRGNVHTAYNSGDGVTELVATFFEAPAEGPLTITDGVEPGDPNEPTRRGGDEPCRSST